MVLLTSSAFTRITFQPCMLLDDMPRLTFNVIYYGLHMQILNCKLSPLYSILYLTYHIRILLVLVQYIRYIETED
jgi:hypothetical protein